MVPSFGCRFFVFFVFGLVMALGLFLFAGGATNSVAGDRCFLMLAGITPSTGIAGSTAKQGRKRNHKNQEKSDLFHRRNSRFR